MDNSKIDNTDNEKKEKSKAVMYKNEFPKHKILLLQKNIRLYLKAKRRSGLKLNTDDRKEHEIYTDDVYPQSLSTINKRKFFNHSKESSKYIGDILNGSRDGFGILKWGEIALYMGYFVNNKATGWGRFKDGDGDEYLGKFLDSKASGYGIYSHNNGASYEGLWFEDSQHGEGEEVWLENYKFRGCYYRGKKQGIGIHYWPDKAFYEGEWLENCLHGYVSNLLI
jgi:hypothetical protein